jgi:hypothetical protein
MKKPPLRWLFHLFPGGEKQSPADSARGIRRAWPAGQALSESPICRRPMGDGAARRGRALPAHPHCLSSRSYPNVRPDPLSDPTQLSRAEIEN